MVFACFRPSFDIWLVSVCAGPLAPRVPRTRGGALLQAQAVSGGGSGSFLVAGACRRVRHARQPILAHTVLRTRLGGWAGLMGSPHAGASSRHWPRCDASIGASVRALRLPASRSPLCFFLLALDAVDLRLESARAVPLYAAVTAHNEIRTGWRRRAMRVAAAYAPLRSAIRVAGHRLEAEGDFTFLCLSAATGGDPEVNARLPKHLRRKRWKILVALVLTYWCRGWLLSADIRAKLDTTVQKMVRRMFGPRSHVDEP